MPKYVNRDSFCQGNGVLEEVNVLSLNFLCSGEFHLNLRIELPGYWQALLGPVLLVTGAIELLSYYLIVHSTEFK